MTAAAIFNILWRFRFPLTVAAFIVSSWVSWSAYSWQSEKLEAERALSKVSRARAEASDQVITNRAGRDAEREKENAALRQRITEILRRDPAAAAWGVTPLPAAVLQLLQAEAGPVGPPRPDASADLAGDDQRRPP